MRNRKLYHAFGESKTLSQWLKDLRCNVASIPALLYRISKGWEIERAISSPVVIEPRGRKSWKGKVFGKLTATAETRVNQHQKVEVLFVCKCGKQVWRAPLKNGFTDNASCGCSRKQITDRDRRQSRRDASRRFRDANREHLQEYKRMWRARNADRTRIYNAKRPVPQIDESHPAWSAKVNPEIQVCHLCGIVTQSPEDRQFDHITPVCRGGNNSPDNIQVICTKCNQQKHSRDNIEYLTEYICVKEPFRFRGHSLVICQSN